MSSRMVEFRKFYFLVASAMPNKIGGSVSKEDLFSLSARYEFMRYSQGWQGVISFKVYVYRLFIYIITAFFPFIFAWRKWRRERMSGALIERDETF